jgi:transcription elongation factor Elf1
MSNILPIIGRKPIKYGEKHIIMEEKETGWVSALIKCDLCGHESLSVHHVSCDKLECANCGHMSHYEVLKNYTDEDNTTL